MFMSPKVHFKTLVEAYDKCTDDKGKQSLREVLIKCKVFRVKQQKHRQEP